MELAYCTNMLANGADIELAPNRGQQPDLGTRTGCRHPPDHRFGRAHNGDVECRVERSEQDRQAGGRASLGAGIEVARRRRGRSRSTASSVTSAPGTISQATGHLRLPWRPARARASNGSRSRKCRSARPVRYGCAPGTIDLDLEEVRPSMTAVPTVSVCMPVSRATRWLCAGPSRAPWRKISATSRS